MIINKLNWVKNKGLNTKNKFYDYHDLETPIGKFSIECKSWEHKPKYNIYLNNLHIECKHELFDAKEYVANYLVNVNNQMDEFIYRNALSKCITVVKNYLNKNKSDKK